MKPSFTGFSPGAFKFFRQLARNNNKAWFDRNRERYDEAIVGAFRALLDRLAPVVLELNPEFEVRGKTNGNFSRINRDIRFSKDKSPYKSSFYCFFYNRSLKPKHDGRLYVGLNPEGVTAGFSIYSGMKDASQLEKVLRPRAARDLKVLEEYWSSKRLASKYDTYWYCSKRGGWEQTDGLPSGPEDWGRLLGWVVRKHFPAALKKVSTPQIAGEIERVFRELYPLYVFAAAGDRDWKSQFEEALG